MANWPAVLRWKDLTRVITVTSWPVTCADVPGAGHRRLQDRGSHNGTSAHHANDLHVCGLRSPMREPAQLTGRAGVNRLAVSGRWCGLADRAGTGQRAPR